MSRIQTALLSAILVAQVVIIILLVKLLVASPEPTAFHSLDRTLADALAQLRDSSIGGGPSLHVEVLPGRIVEVDGERIPLAEISTFGKDRGWDRMKLVTVVHKSASLEQDASEVYQAFRKLGVGTVIESSILPMSSEMITFKRGPLLTGEDLTKRLEALELEEKRKAAEPGATDNPGGAQ